MTVTVDRKKTSRTKPKQESRPTRKFGPWRCAGLTDFGVMWVRHHVAREVVQQQVVWVHPNTGEPVRSDERILPTQQIDFTGDQSEED
jgi:hypothetical protein